MLHIVPICGLKKFVIIVCSISRNTLVPQLTIRRCYRFICITRVEVMKKSRLVRETVRAGFWLVGILCLSRIAAAEDHPAFQPVKELFAAMSKHDGKAMQEQATEDFQLLEHGEDWSMQMLVDAVQPKGDPYERKNFFKQIRARQEGNVVWISYWNKAEIRRTSGLRTVVWLESAVIVKQGDRWKVQLLHSTRVDSDKYPKDVEWIQFDSKL